MSITKNVKGSIRSYNEHNQCGLINVMGNDVFFQAKAVLNMPYLPLSEEMAVSFDLVDGPNGYQAVNVQVL